MKWLIILLIAALLTAFGFLIFDILGNEDFGRENLETEEVIQDEGGLENNESDVVDTTGGVSDGVSGVADSSDGVSGVADSSDGVSDEDIGGGDGGENNGDSDSLPGDLESVECGFYFERYDVCAGTCPTGECVSQGRSCYCRVG